MEKKYKNGWNPVKTTWNKGLKRILNNKGIYICQ